MADVLGCTQGNVGFLERGQQLQFVQAKAVQRHAADQGWSLTLDQIYAVDTLPHFEMTDSVEMLGATSKADSSSCRQRQEPAQLKQVFL